MPKSIPVHRPTSSAQEDYLKALHRLSGGDTSHAVSTSQLAEELEVNPGSVSEMLGKLATLRLVIHDPYRGARLTPAGLAIAVEMIRHHRLIETYLVQALGYRWDEVHEEADRLEHSISELLEERMWRALGQPEFDPHGDPIPTPDGRVVQQPTRPLHTVASGSQVRISRISDRDPAKLRAIEGLGLLPGTEVRVVEESTWESPVEVEVDRARIAVPLGLARTIHVVADDA
ncbi:MAG TPA: metal-dependent transcriptional regulator [Actinomycetota bacterium]|jgi:DtxR family Mn-dependent transcriptional regulator